MHPILFKIGSFTVHTYGLILVIALLAATVVASREAKRLGMPQGEFYDLCFYLIVAALVGARLLFVILEPRFFFSHPAEIFKIWHGGLDFHGGLILAVLVVLFVVRRRRWSYGAALDALALGLALGQGIGRIGCFMSGDSFGIPTHVPWAVTFTNPASLAPLNIPLQPTQLYMSALGLGIFGLLYWFRTRKRYKGQVALIYLFLASLGRFVIEFYRSPLDYRGPVFFGWMPLTQLFALILFVVSGALLLYFSFKYQPQAQPQHH